MKLSLFFVAALAVFSVSAVPLVYDDEPEVPYERYIEFIDENGVKNTIDLEEEPDVEFLNSITRDNDINGYFLFTRSNPDNPQQLFKDDAESIKNSNFNSKDNTVVIAHGWLSNQESGLNPAIRDAFFNVGSYNVIVLDWRPLAMRNYITSAGGVPEVGRNLGRFLAFLSSVTGIGLDTVHLVGFSLGAHLVGNAGRELGGKVARITALDPAGPLFNLNSNKVRSDDAIYVEGIHTDGGLSISLGIGYSIGDVDFFPNGGNNQPGCFTTSICSHNRAWRVFAATVSYNHLEGRSCSNILQINLNTCRGDRLRMGNGELYKSGSGRYRANTRRRYPY
ncbi:unnamed protein product [Diatraea saccharalis]|uniref:Lipase domain-containing protein n=1 Tax=Diatraea saccharalis TaxID=40085 RepID=A0A9N9WHG0_9NEOP|nr:unnamed protein product [Diatraea saccharalis]